MQTLIRNQLQHHRHMVAVMDPEFNFIAVNELYAEADDKHPDDFPGKNHFSLYPDADVQALFEQVVTSGRPHYEESRPFRYKHAPERGLSYWDWSLLPIRNEDGDLRGLLLTLVNTTSRVLGLRQQEALNKQLTQAQKLEAIGQLTGGIAHDFNNLLAVILGNAELARLNLDRAHPVHEDLKEIVIAAERARDLTARLLTFARRDTPRKDLHRVGSLIEDLAVLLQRSLSNKIELKLQQQDDSLLEIDRNQIIQALLNICHNASDALLNGGVLEIRVEIVDLSKRTCGCCGQTLSGPWCRIGVEDNGPGIPPDIADRVFEPFYTTKIRGAGTGLGLSVSHGIVLNHGGHLKIDSTPGQGTSVSMLLPLSEKIESRAPALSPDQELRGLKLLLVDDEPQVLRAARRLLEVAGHHVLQAENGEQAKTLFAEAPDSFDLLVLDMTMPDMDGLQLFAALKAIRPNVKVLLSSGYRLDDRAAEIRAQGIRGVVQKPFSYDRLMAAIAEALG